MCARPPPTLRVGLSLTGELCITRSSASSSRASRPHLSLSEERSTRASCNEARGGRGLTHRYISSRCIALVRCVKPLPNPLLGQGEGTRTHFRLRMPVMHSSPDRERRRGGHRGPSTPQTPVG